MDSAPVTDTSIADGPIRVPAAVKGSLSRRMILIAAVWIGVLLSGGGFALDRVLSAAVTRNFDDQLEYVLRSLLNSSEIGPDGEVIFSREAAADQRFVEPYSGLYWQVSGKGREDFPSRSLWDRRLAFGGTHDDRNAHFYDSTQFPDEKLRVVERDAVIPGSKVHWRFQVAQSRDGLDAQITTLRRTLVRSFALLALGLIVMAALQTFYGLWPLRRVREEIARMRAGQSNRVSSAMPVEVAPMVEELNALIEHNERQAEEARRHAGNLAHALKTPLTVIMNAATAQSDDLADTVIREARTMRRQVDHHLARARAVGRRGSAHSRADVWPSLESVERAVGRLYRHVRIDVTGPRGLRQSDRERGEIWWRQRVRDGRRAVGVRRVPGRGRRGRHSGRGAGAYLRSGCAAGYGEAGDGARAGYRARCGGDLRGDGCSRGERGPWWVARAVAVAGG
jgi:signal transduction histidine kinase